MVFISKRIRLMHAERQNPAPKAVEFNPFADEDGAVVGPKVQRMLDFVNEVDSPPHTSKKSELAPARCREAELKHPRPIRRVALQDALSRFEEMVNQPDFQLAGKVTDQNTLARFEDMVGSQTAPRNEDMFASASSPTMLSFDEVFHCGLSEERTNPFLPPAPNATNIYTTENTYHHAPASLQPLHSSNDLHPSGSIVCPSPGFLEHLSGHQHGLPAQPTSILNGTSVEDPMSVYSLIPTAASQVTGCELAGEAEAGEGLWHEYKPIGSSVDNPDLIWDKFRWSFQDVDMTAFDIANDTLQSVILAGGLDESSGSDSSSLFSRPWPAISLPSPNLSANDSTTIWSVPSQPEKAEDVLMNAPLDEEGTDSWSFLSQHWPGVMDDAPRFTSII